MMQLLCFKYHKGQWCASLTSVDHRFPKCPCFEVIVPGECPCVRVITSKLAFTESLSVRVREAVKKHAFIWGKSEMWMGGVGFLNF